MTAAEGHEVPRAAGGLLERADVEDARQRDLVGDVRGVLQVDVMDRVAEGTDRRERVHLLPEQV